MRRIKNKVVSIFRKAEKCFNIVGEIWQFNVTSRINNLLPREIIINLTYACNSRCTMCNIWRIHPKGEMTCSDWEKILDDPFFSEVRAITISGGEPTLHPEFNQIAELLVVRLPKLKSLSMVSNGFLTDSVVKKVERLARFCGEKKISFGISVSMDGLQKEQELVRRIPNGFSKTWKTIKELKKMQRKIDFNLSVGTVILRQNLDKIEEIDKWLSKYKIDHDFQIVGFHKTFVNNLETKDKINFRVGDVPRLMRVLKKMRDRGGPGAYYWADLMAMYKDKLARTTPCPFLVDQSVIDGMGNVYYCLSVRPIGNFLRERRTIAEIYLDPKNIKFRKSLPKKFCVNCNSGCNVRRAMVYDFKKLVWFNLTGKLWR